MRTLFITNIHTKQTQFANMVDAAHLIQVDFDELEAAFEEYGIYENARYTVGDFVVLQENDKLTSESERTPE
jgi:hypothetical protein